jgi:hypothetical protein
MNCTNFKKLTNISPKCHEKLGRCVRFNVITLENDCSAGTKEHTCIDLPTIKVKKR